jgi:hypothetical protein
MRTFSVWITVDWASTGRLARDNDSNAGSNANRNRARIAGALWSLIERAVYAETAIQG